MADLDSAMKRIGFHSLKLNRQSAMVGALFEYRDGRETVIWNSGVCFPAGFVQNTGSADLMQLEKTYECSAKGFLNIFSRLFDKGGLKPELDAKSIYKVNITLTKLSQDEMQIGLARDYLEKPAAKGGMPNNYRRDVLFERYLTIIAALKVEQMLFEFLNSKGVQVKLQAVDISGWLGVGGQAGVSITSEGSLAISTPSYIGYAYYSGNTWHRILNERRAVSPITPSHALAAQLAGPQTVRAYAMTEGEVKWLVEQSKEAD
jgi:hypothetical protein